MAREEEIVCVTMVNIEIQDTRALGCECDEYG